MYGLREQDLGDEPWPWFHTLVWGLLEEPSSRLGRLYADRHKRRQ